MDELRVLEQRGKTVDEYVQEFRRAVRGSGYEKRVLVEEFKRGLSGAIKRRLTEAEMPPTTIVQWQEKAVQLDHNMRQSRAEEKILGSREGNTACPAMGNTQQLGGQRLSWNNRTFRRSWVPRGGWQQRGAVSRLIGGGREPGAMAVDREQGGGDQTCFNCQGFGHMA